MTMTLDLLNRTFTDIETLYTIVEAREKGIFFFKCVQSIKGDLQGDYWLQVGREWDLNFYEVDNHYYMSTYRIIDGMTVTTAPVSSILLDARELL